jgi:hypothetical protein
MLWLPWGARFPLAHGSGVARLTKPVGGQLLGGEGSTNPPPGSHPFFLPVSHPKPTAGATSAKRLVDLKGYKVSQAVRARPRQCMGHRLARHHPRACGGLPLGNPRPRRVEAAGTLRGLPRGPRERRVAIVDVALACPLPVAAFRPFDPATGRGSVAPRRQAAPSARVQPNRLGPNRPDAIAGPALLRGGRGLQSGRHGLCERFALVAQPVQECETAGDRQPLVGLGKPARAGCLGALVHPLRPEARTGLARQAVGHPEHLGRVRPNQGRACAPDLPHGPRGLGGAGPCGPHAQSSHLGQPARIGMGLRRLQAALLLQRGRVGQMHPVVRCHPAVDEPGPVRGRLHHHALDV